MGAVLKFDSFLVSFAELGPGTPRLLIASQNLELPIRSHVEVKVTSSDILHSWAVLQYLRGQLWISAHCS